MGNVIVVLILIVIIIVLLYLLYFKITRKIKKMAKDILGTEEVVQALKEIEEESRSTPLSVSGGNKLYLPRIQTDFPDYHQETMEEKVKHFMIIYFNALEKKDSTYLSNIEITETVKEEILSEISD